MKRITVKIAETAAKYPSIKRVVLFGSRARGDAGPGSDYDIAVWGCTEKEKTMFLSELDELDTLRKIDVMFISKEDMDKPIYRNIEKEGIDIMNKFQNKLSNYENALSRLHEGINEAGENDGMLIRDGVIQRFEFTAELAWKTVREYLISEEIAELNSPKSVMREAFSNRLISDEYGWIQILKDRNSTSHIYDEEETDKIYQRIINTHIELLDALLEELKNKIKK